MPINRFESSRISEGTLVPGAQHIGKTAREVINESRAISRDDVRDGATDAGYGRNRDFRDEPHTRVVSATSVVGDRVRNRAGEDLGVIEEIMVDTPTGRVAYAVLSFGGFLGIGNKLFAVPWSALQLNENEHEFILDVDRETIEGAPGFDKENWPDMADPSFADAVQGHYRKLSFGPH